MEYEYIVEVRDCMHGVLLEHERFDDANTAYRHYRLLDDRYYDDELVAVTLHEPE